MLPVEPQKINAILRLNQLSYYKISNNNDNWIIQRTYVLTALTILDNHKMATTFSKHHFLSRVLFHIYGISSSLASLFFQQPKHLSRPCSWSSEKQRLLCSKTILFFTLGFFKLNISMLVCVHMMSLHLQFNIIVM